MTIDQNELETLKQLTPEERYFFFMENVLETSQVWSLCGAQGWASFLDEGQGIQAFPIWPEKELAEINAINQWAGFEAREFTIQQLIEELTPSLVGANYQFSVFKLPEDSGHLIAADLVATKLKKKLAS